MIKLGDTVAPYLIDLDYCKGCGLCVAECPSGAIAMVPEEISNGRDPGQKRRASDPQLPTGSAPRA